MTPDQQAFEDRCWEHYLAERARRTMPGDVEGEPTREGLFWRREDGQYGVLAFNTAWMAYQWGMQAVRGQGAIEPESWHENTEQKTVNDAERLAEEMHRQFMNDDCDCDTMIDASIELRRLSAELAALKAAMWEPDDADVWCEYVAEMVGAYISEPVGSEKVKAISGIIRRRMPQRFFASAPPAPQAAQRGGTHGR